MDAEVDDKRQSDFTASSPDADNLVEVAGETPKIVAEKPSPGRRKLLFVVIIVVLLLAAGFFFRRQIKGLVGGKDIQPVSSPSVQAPQPSSTLNPLVRSDWSFEVLNGSGKSGFAKDIAGKLQALGYQVVKTGNADRNDYQRTEVLVKKNLLDKIDLIIADLKDTIKIASIAGELTEGTASARIIIGKDSI